MPKIIPVLFSSANHLTPAHVQIVTDAALTIRSMVPNSEIPKGIISPVNDVYLLNHKRYDPIMINGTLHARSIFTGQERLKMAQATVKDMAVDLPIEVSDFEINNISVPHGSKRGYIEHWEMLEHLQRQEIVRSQQEGDEPALYVLIGGADLAVGMSNWGFIPGMPFLIATRKTTQNPNGHLNHNNFSSPDAYLKKLGYEGTAFTKFQSGVFESQNNQYNSLSSTKLAECNPEALKLMGKQAFTQLVDILTTRATQPHFQDQRKEAQRLTAKATLTVFNHYIQKGILECKTEIINEMPSSKKIVYPTSYELICSQYGTALQKARALLNDYTKGNSGLVRFFHGHWDRHYTKEIGDIVNQIDSGLITSLLQLKTTLALIQPENLQGSAARRIGFINSELDETLDKLTESRITP